MLLKFSTEEILHLLKTAWPIIAAFLGFLILFELSRIPGRMRAKKAFAHLSGRTMGTVVNLYEDKTLITSANQSSDGRDHYDSRTIVTYQYEVNGQLHTGEGEGSGAFRDRKQQMICYDPEDPGNSCTLYFLNSKTKSHFVQTLVTVVIMLVLLVLAIVFGSKIQ